MHGTVFFRPQMKFAKLIAWVTLVTVMGLRSSDVSAAVTHYVTTNGPGPSPYTNWTTAASNIPDALTASAATDDTILVTNGTYLLSSQIDVSKSVTIKSVNGYGSTIVNGNGAYRCFYIHASSAVVDGFTITNGYKVSGQGAGVYIDTAGGTVRNCLITGNIIPTSDGGSFGAGVFLTSGGLVENCIIRGNVAAGYRAGGVWIGGGVLRNCLVVSNYAGNQGAGIYMAFGTGTGEIQNCTITGNGPVTNQGSGIMVECWGTAVPTVYNTISYLNPCAINDPASSNLYIVSGTLTNNFSNNCMPQAAAILLPLSGSGNINVDPQYRDPAGGDFRLRKGSPCMETGTNQGWMAGALDLDGHPRIFYGASVDMGAYEYFVPGGTLFSFH